jgi:hypothetical protein
MIEELQVWDIACQCVSEKFVARYSLAFVNGLV